eukprot:TRINITY_DN4222_c0_g1_i2.p1 TRINITY_DN4222_c0_g1~~TRINITY_DN4222_c0_g1_i2.p1  ORF type:complete len:145 (+),score=15.22 TRINITY_DN4222_c0_g1_i2:71-505(+)
MVFYLLVIFNRQGKCLFTMECNKRRTKKGKPEQEQKLMFGLLHSLKSFVNRITPRPLDQLESEPLNSFVTKGYKLHYFETLSGLRFVLTTDPTVGNLQELLRSVYALYVEYVSKNPLYQVGDSVDCQLFVSKLSEYMRAHPNFG